MKRLAEVDLGRVGTMAALRLCTPDTSYRIFQVAGLEIHKGMAGAVEQVRIYLKNSEGVLCEEALVDRQGGMEGSDIIPLYQLAPELVKSHQVWQHGLGNQYEVLVPLVSQGELVGLVALVSFQSFPDEVLELLPQFAQGLVVGVVLVLRSREAERSESLLRAATTTARALQSASGAETLLGNFAVMAVEEMGFDRATFLVLGDDGKNVRKAICARAGSGLVELTTVPDFPDLDTPAKDHLPGLWIPMRVGARLLGALFVDNLYSVEPLPEDAVQVLSDLSGQAALALENSRLIDRLREAALRDDLTGLYRPNYFNERASEELANCLRRGDSTGLLMLDLDRFKEINDTWGHPVGDQVLIRVAERMRTCLRVGDIACRKGGDEFIILVPGLNAERGRRLAERLLEDVWNNPVELSGGRAIRISLSVGVALFPDHGDNWMDFWQHADDALYQAKTAGRSRYALWGEEVSLVSHSPVQG
ncbi:MAG: PleD product [Fibrobacterota bacterium]|jgi:diguanylate cyclase (GGDEF)-like protein